MSKIKNLVVLFAATAAAIGLFSIFSFDSNNTAGKFSPDAPQLHQQTKSESTTEVQPAPTGQDPFNKFLEDKPNNSSSSLKPVDVQVMPTQAGKDPKGKVAVEVGTEKELVPTLELIKTAVLNGELDTQIDAAANKLRDGFAH